MMAKAPSPTALDVFREWMLKTGWTILLGVIGVSVAWGSTRADLTRVKTDIQQLQIDEKQFVTRDELYRELRMLNQNVEQLIELSRLRK